MFYWAKVRETTIPSSILRVSIFFTEKTSPGTKTEKMGQKLDTLHFREITSDIDSKYVTAVTRWMPSYVMITATDVT